MSEHLKPCPFCGGKAKLIELEDWFRGVAYVRCDDCSAEIDCSGTASEAVKAWNRRAPDATLSAKVERLRGERDAAIMEVSRHAAARGRAEGALEASETAGVVEGWRARAEAAEARVAELRDLLLLARPLLSWAPPGAGGAECMFTIDAALSHTKEG